MMLFLIACLIVQVAHYVTRGAEFADELLRSTVYANVRIPYRQNRIVVFDSALYHKTDSFRFREGYENLRINLTLLLEDAARGRCAGGGGVVSFLCPRLAAARARQPHSLAPWLRGCVGTRACGAPTFASRP